MARQVILSCDNEECITKKHCPTDSGPVEEREFIFNGNIYGMDLDVVSYAIKEATLEKIQAKFDEDVAKLASKMMEAAYKVLAPSIAMEQVRPLPSTKKEEPEKAASNGYAVKNPATALDRAIKWYYAQHPEWDQPNASRQRVATKFLPMFFAMEEVWEGWKDGDPIPEGWVDDGKVCKLADPNIKA